MQMLARVRRPSLRHGLFWGLILGGSEIILSVATSIIPQAGVQSFLGTVALALFIILGFMAGQRAAQETGRLGSGAMAGLWAGLIGSVLWGVAQFVQILILLPTLVSEAKSYFQTHPKQLPSGYNPANLTSTDVLLANLEPLVLSLIFYTLFALIGGALGGMLGRRRVARSSEYIGEEAVKSIE